MPRRHRTPLIAAAAVITMTTLTACTVVQDTFQVGEREFAFATAADARASGESFRFQGFLPSDATDVRLRARLDGHAAVMRWTSPSPFSSEHCVTAPVGTEPVLEADWVPSALPEEGSACGIWIVVSDGDTHVAWNDPPSD